MKGNLTEAVEIKPKATRVIWQQRPKIQATESKPFCSRKIHGDDVTKILLVTIVSQMTAVLKRSKVNSRKAQD